jgi:hypothetical protein
LENEGDRKSVMKSILEAKYEKSDEKETKVMLRASIQFISVLVKQRSIFL